MARGAVRIGTASEQTGLSIDAIRFYEKQRLLERPARTEGGFRLFGGEDIQRLRFIRTAHGLGFSLSEIRELLALQRDGAEACSHVRDLLRAKLGATRLKIRDLNALDRQLTKALRKCERRLRGSVDSHAGCPVLEEIGFSNES